MSSSSPAETPSDRIHALDAIRAFALLLGVVHHATLSFVPDVPPGVVAPVQDVSTSKPLALLAFTGHVFRMSLFFLLAGFLARLVIQRAGVAKFCVDRLQRILVPLIFSWLAFFPCVSIAWHWGTHHDFSHAQLVIWPRSLERFPLSYLWFLYYLLLIYALILVARGAVLLIDRGGQLRRAADSVVRWVVEHAWLGVVVLTVPLAAGLLTETGSSILGGIITPNDSLVPHALPLLAYGAACALGWLLHRNARLLTVWQGNYRLNLSAAVLATGICILSYPHTRLDDPLSLHTRLLFAVTYAFASWTWVFGITGLALRHYSTPSPVRRYVADASYWIYLVHYPIVLALQDALATVHIHWIVKFPVILGVTFAITLVTYHYFVRFTIIGRVLNGRRRGKPAVLIPPADDRIAKV